MVTRRRVTPEEAKENVLSGRMTFFLRFQSEKTRAAYSFLSAVQASIQQVRRRKPRKRRKKKRKRKRKRKATSRALLVLWTLLSILLFFFFSLLLILFPPRTPHIPREQFFFFCLNTWRRRCNIRCEPPSHLPPTINQDDESVVRTNTHTYVLVSPVHAHTRKRKSRTL